MTLSQINDSVSSVLNAYLEPRLRKGSLHATKKYIEGVRVARKIAISSFGLGALSSLLVGGLVLTLIGVLALMPITTEALAITVISIGLVMFFGSLAGAFTLFSEKRWLEKSKSYEMIDAALSPWDKTLPPNPLGVMRGEGPHGAMVEPTPPADMAAAATMMAPGEILAAPPVDAPATLAPQLARY